VRHIFQRLGGPFRLLDAGFRIQSMNLAEIESLRVRITTRLQNVGPATSQRLAIDLAVPHQNVRAVLETSRRGKVVPVKRLPFGFWDITEDRGNVA